ncbi:MAG: glucose sorbosone dehydrogenase [Phycisphaerales bacterium]|nr:glucose sorbosone dehydrogenase [Phycisphaerales bacterium]
MTCESLSVVFPLAISLAFLGAADAQQTPSASAPTIATTAVPAIPKVKMQRVWSNLKLRRPIQIVSRADRPELLYVVEQAGRILEIDATNPQSEGRLVLDIKEPVQDKYNEQGLLSVAFHPKFAQNRFVYAWYTAKKDATLPDRDVLARFTANEDGTIDAASQVVLLHIEDPAWNHNGGTVLFGADGFLYLSTGDGGAGNDPWGNGQNMQSLLAKVLRIDVDHPGEGKPYGIPADNPFVGRADAAPEIYALGLRNVWRMSFDRQTGELYAGDVGQNAWEEIDIVTKGGNYGWRPREGFHPTPGVPDSSEASAQFIEPIAAYPRREGVSVTGGFVARGTSDPRLHGIYHYADYESGTMWGLRAVAGKVIAPPVVVGGKRGFHPASFGEAADGSLFMCGTEGGADGPGSIYRLSAAP